MQLEFSKDIYPKSVLIKAAYSFTDRYYIHLSQNNSNYFVAITNKTGEDEINSGEFANEMLVQAARYEVFRETKNIRELLVARAMASTMIGDESEYGKDVQIEDYDVSEILNDWFDKNDEN